MVKTIYFLSWFTFNFLSFLLILTSLLLKTKQSTFQCILVILMISEIGSIPKSVNQSDHQLHFKDINAGGLVHNGYPFHKSGVMKNGIAYYRCAQKRRYKCPATININTVGTIKTNGLKHNHLPRKTKVSLFAGQITLFNSYFLMKL